MIWFFEDCYTWSTRETTKSSLIADLPLKIADIGFIMNIELVDNSNRFPTSLRTIKSEHFTKRYDHLKITI